MKLMLIDALSGAEVFSCETASEGVVPVAGDVFLAPDGGALRILQRAFISTVDTGCLVDLSAPRSLSTYIQCATCPLGQEDAYTQHFTEGGTDAVKN